MSARCRKVVLSGIDRGKVVGRSVTVNIHPTTDVSRPGDINPCSLLMHAGIVDTALLYLGGVPFIIVSNVLDTR